MKRPALITLALVSTLTLGMGGCASGRNLLRPDKESADQIQRLKSRITDLQRQVRVNEVELRRLRERMSQIEGRTTHSARPRAAGAYGSSPPSTDSGPSPEPIAPPTYVPPANSRVDPPAPRELASPRTVTIEEGDLELPPSAAQEGSPSTPPPALANSEASPVEPLPAEGQTLYDRGYAQHNEGRYVDAEATFQQFLQAYPHTQLSDNAQYWIGEARLARGDNRGALAAFFETVEKFPRGNKVPDALLKAARCLLATGDRGGSRMTYDELVHRFPNTRAAAVAEEERRKLP